MLRTRRKSPSTQHESIMKKKVTIVAVVVCLSAAGVLLSINRHSRHEPTYRGILVGHWARQSRHAVIDDSVRVLQEMGAEAVPYLTNQLTMRDGPLQRAWLWIWPKLPAVIRARFRPPVKASELRAASAWDLLQLGPAAKEAVPSPTSSLRSR